jgi:hypothetical protein
MCSIECVFLQLVAQRKIIHVYETALRQSADALQTQFFNQFIVDKREEEIHRERRHMGKAKTMLSEWYRNLRQREVIYNKDRLKNTHPLCPAPCSCFYMAHGIDFDSFQGYPMRCPICGERVTEEACSAWIGV